MRFLRSISMIFLDTSRKLGGSNNIIYESYLMRFIFLIFCVSLTAYHDNNNQQLNEILVSICKNRIFDVNKNGIYFSWNYIYLSIWLHYFTSLFHNPIHNSGKWDQVSRNGSNIMYPRFIGIHFSHIKY